MVAEFWSSSLFKYSGLITNGGVMVIGNKPLNIILEASGTYRRIKKCWSEKFAGDGIGLLNSTINLMPETYAEVTMYVFASLPSNLNSSPGSRDHGNVTSENPDADIGV